MSMSTEMIVTAAELGAILALTERHVRRLRKDGVFPSVGPKFDLRVCVRAYIKLLREGATGTSLADEKLGLVRAKRKQLELMNAQREGRLIDIAIVEEVLLAQAAHLAQTHDAVAGRIASDLVGILDPGVIRGKLLAEMRAIREGLSQHSLRIADALDRAAQDVERQEARQNVQRS